MLPVHSTLILLLLMLFAAVQLLCAPSARADGLAVIYPEVREPYRQLFVSILDGIRSAYKGPVVSYELAENGRDDALAARLEAQRADAVIALGNRGLAALPYLPKTLPAVAGAALLDPAQQTVPGISLVPSPHRLFAQLLQLQPDIKAVHVIYSGAGPNWLIERARTAAKEAQLELVEHRADSVYALAQRYRDVLGRMSGDRDALWIAHDGRGLDQALMEQLLETAWQRELLIFSSNLVDVRRGVLFALYPDHKAMGAELAEMAARVQDGRRSGGAVEPVDALLSAVNLRTADHLGLHFSAAVRQGFSMTLP